MQCATVTAMRCSWGALRKKFATINSHTGDKGKVGAHMSPQPWKVGDDAKRMIPSILYHRNR